MKVVTNSSLLILLAKIDRLQLLADLYTQIYIPNAVLEEVREKGSAEQKLIVEFSQTISCVVVTPSIDYFKQISTLLRLGRGERAAIALAFQE